MAGRPCHGPSAPVPFGDGGDEGAVFFVVEGEEDGPVSGVGMSGEKLREVGVGAPVGGEGVGGAWSWARWVAHTDSGILE
jgi:hypothetical protein